jgi:hypothetical protein
MKTINKIVTGLLLSMSAASVIAATTTPAPAKLPTTLQQLESVATSPENQYLISQGSSENQVLLVILQQLTILTEEQRMSNRFLVMQLKEAQRTNAILQGLDPSDTASS